MKWFSGSGGLQDRPLKILKVVALPSSNKSKKGLFLEEEASKACIALGCVRTNLSYASDSGKNAGLSFNPGLTSVSTPTSSPLHGWAGPS